MPRIAKVAAARVPSQILQNNETPIPLEELRKILPRKPGLQTVRNWATAGLLNWNNRRRVFLETVRIASGKATSIEAYRRFIERLNEA